MKYDPQTGRQLAKERVVKVGRKAFRAAYPQWLAQGYEARIIHDPDKREEARIIHDPDKREEATPGEAEPSVPEGEVKKSTNNAKK